ncbi:MAG: hypothetical protein RLZZ617_431 [Bacteroidota bacterium]
MKDGSLSSIHGDLLFQQWVPGKILLSGEYVVLDGATALGLASRMGQSMAVFRGSEPGYLRWTALDHLHNPWLQANYRIVDGQWSVGEVSAEASESAGLLQNWLQAAWTLMAGLGEGSASGYGGASWNDILHQEGMAVQTQLDFARSWGLGSSSTALALLAQWLGVDARRLYALTTNGSGYDLEVALQNASILYHLPEGRPITNSHAPALLEPIVQPIPYRSPQGGGLWLVDPGGKQISAKEVVRYRNLDTNQRMACVEEISSLSIGLATCPDVTTMLDYFVRHDTILENLLGQPCLQRSAGNGFPGRLKSLGAWGGDLFLAVSPSPEDALHWLENQANWSIYPFEQIIQCEPYPLDRL